MGTVHKFPPERRERRAASRVEPPAPAYVVGDPWPASDAARDSAREVRRVARNRDFVDAYLDRRVRRARLSLACWAVFFYVIGWWPVSVWLGVCFVFAGRIVRRRARA